MKIVKVDIHGTRGLALRDDKGSRVTVAPDSPRGASALSALHRRTRP